MTFPGLREWFAQRDGNCSLPSVPRIPKLGTAKTRKRSALQNVASLPEMPSAGQSNYDESEYDDDDMQFYADSEVSLF